MHSVTRKIRFALSLNLPLATEPSQVCDLKTVLLSRLWWEVGIRNVLLWDPPQASEGAAGKAEELISGLALQEVPVWAWCVREEAPEPCLGEAQNSSPELKDTQWWFQAQQGTRTASLRKPLRASAAWQGSSTCPTGCGRQPLGALDTFFGDRDRQEKVEFENYSSGKGKCVRCEKSKPSHLLLNAHLPPQPPPCAAPASQAASCPALGWGKGCLVTAVA